MIRNVTVIDVRDGTYHPDQTVMIVGRRIQAITPAKRTRPQKGARLVDARGKYLIPGLWDMHVHPMRYADIAYPLFLANGVTGVRDAGSDAPLDTLTRWKREIAVGGRVGPRVLVSGPALNEADGRETAVRQGEGREGHFLYVPQALAARVVDSLRAAGADFIKTYGMSRAMYLAVAAEARRVGLPFGGHVSNNAALGGLEASDSGATFLDHWTWFNPNVCGGDSDDGIPVAISHEACAAGARHLRRNHTWVTVVAEMGIDSVMGMSQRVFFDYFEALHLRYLPQSFPDHQRDSALAGLLTTVHVPASSTAWVADTANSFRALIARWHAADIPMLIGTDANIAPRNLQITAGFAVHQALLGLVLGGLTPLEALQIATINAAEALRATDSLEAVKPGHLADLVLLDADPLADIGNTTKIHAVVADGRYYDRAALDRLLSDAERAARR